MIPKEIQYQLKLYQTRIRNMINGHGQQFIDVNEVMRTTTKLTVNMDLA
jgi:hypothetical protein